MHQHLVICNPLPVLSYVIPVMASWQTTTTTFKPPISTVYDMIHAGNLQ